MFSVWCVLRKRNVSHPSRYADAQEALIGKVQRTCRCLAVLVLRERWWSRLAVNVEKVRVTCGRRAISAWWSEALPKHVLSGLMSSFHFSRRTSASGWRTEPKSFNGASKKSRTYFGSGVRRCSVEGITLRRMRRISRGTKAKPCSEPKFWSNGWHVMKCKPSTSSRNSSGRFRRTLGSLQCGKRSHRFLRRGCRRGAAEASFPPLTTCWLCWPPCSLTDTCERVLSCQRTCTHIARNGCTFALHYTTSRSTVDRRRHRLKELKHEHIMPSPRSRLTGISPENLPATTSAKTIEEDPRGWPRRDVLWKTDY